MILLPQATSRCCARARIGDVAADRDHSDTSLPSRRANKTSNARSLEVQTAIVPIESLTSNNDRIKKCPEHVYSGNLPLVVDATRMFGQTIGSKPRWAAGVRDNDNNHDRRKVNMKVHPSVTIKRVTKAYERTLSTCENPGFCIACGAKSNSCEPDARNYPCARCKKNEVFGVEELMMEMV